MAIEGWSPKIKRELFEQTFRALETVGVDPEAAAVQLKTTPENVIRIQQEGHKKINAHDLMWYTDVLTGWAERIHWNPDKKPNTFIPVNEEIRQEKYEMFLDTFGIWIEDVAVQTYRAQALDISIPELEELQKNGPWSIEQNTIYSYAETLARKRKPEQYKSLPKNT